MLIEKDKEIDKEKPRKLVLDPFRELAMRMDMEQKHKISSLTDVAMVDPFKKSSLKKAINTVKNIDFFTEVYSEDIMEEVLDEMRKSDTIRPPKTVFVPDKALLRRIMRAMIMFGKEDHSKVLFRFGLKENFIFTQN